MIVHKMLIWKKLQAILWKNLNIKDIEKYIKSETHWEQTRLRKWLEWVSVYWG